MLKILRISFAIIASFLAIYFLVTNKPLILNYSIFFVGITFLVTGISELKEKRKSLAYLSFGVSGFSIFVAIFTFLS
ncbi:DUF3953 domain-containing protein [Metabacillus fastidiosus]|uniref:DUF3953 domain-containing protein n=1 Tax=Metabacillus fastidiosus TaxID=1458 RepID=A0ABU6P452_9BACI|nr:DUF3953 domain-containing protein [Metabacillus fastidiosus]